VTPFASRWESQSHLTPTSSHSSSTPTPTPHRTQDALYLLDWRWSVATLLVAWGANPRDEAQCRTPAALARCVGNPVADLLAYFAGETPLEDLPVFEEGAGSGRDPFGWLVKTAEERGEAAARDLLRTSPWRLAAAAAASDPLTLLTCAVRKGCRSLFEAVTQQYSLDVGTGKELLKHALAVGYSAYYCFRTYLASGDEVPQPRRIIHELYVSVLSAATAAATSSGAAHEARENMICTLVRELVVEDARRRRRTGSGDFAMGRPIAGGSGRRSPADRARVRAVPPAAVWCRYPS
jgi:hypothetical protein